MSDAGTPDPSWWRWLIRNIAVILGILGAAGFLVGAGVAYGDLRAETRNLTESVKKIQATMLTKEDLQREMQGITREISQTAKLLSAQNVQLAADVAAQPRVVSKYLQLHETWQSPTPTFLLWPASGRIRYTPDRAVEIFAEAPEGQVQAVLDSRVVVCDRLRGTVVAAFTGNPDWTTTYENLSAVAVKLHQSLKPGDPIGNVVSSRPLVFRVSVQEYRLNPLLYLPRPPKKPKPKPE